MILVISKGQGDYAEDYTQRVEMVLEIPHKGLTPEKLEKSYNAFLAEKVKEETGLLVNKESPTCLLPIQVEGTKVPKNAYIKVYKVLDKYSLFDYVMSTYKNVKDHKFLDFIY